MIFIILIVIAVVLYVIFSKKYVTITSTVTSFVDMYNFAEGNDRKTKLRNALKFRENIIRRDKPLFLGYTSLLDGNDFLDLINDDISLAIFTILMIEIDLCNIEFSNHPEKYIKIIEEDVLKKMNNYQPNVQNITIAKLISSTYSRNL